MKNIKNYIASLLLTGAMFGMVSCEVEEDEHYFKGQNFVAFNQDAYALNEEAIEPLKVTVGASVLHGVKKDVVIEYTVGGNAVEGKDYILNTPRTITIPAGENIATIEFEPINNDNYDLERTIELTITSVSDPNLIIGINNKEKLQSSVVVNVVNDDCLVNTSYWEGSVKVTRASTGGTHIAPIGKNAANDCDILSIKGNAFGLNANAITRSIVFIPETEGAKKGIVRLPKQNVGLIFVAPIGILTVEGNGDGAYDETTGEFWLNVTMKYEDGTIFRQDKYTFKKAE